MANYKIIGNEPVEKLFGSRENAEKALKAMNICSQLPTAKAVGLRLPSASVLPKELRRHQALQ